MESKVNPNIILIGEDNTSLSLIRNYLSMFCQTNIQCKDIDIVFQEIIQYKNYFYIVCKFNKGSWWKLQRILNFNKRGEFLSNLFILYSDVVFGIKLERFESINNVPGCVICVEEDINQYIDLIDSLVVTEGFST